MRNYDLKDGTRVVATFRAQMNLRKCHSIEEKAESLWKAYFDYLEMLHPDDFANSTTNGRLQLAEKVKTLTHSCSFKEATETVFSLDRIENSIANNSTVWQVPYLVVYRILKDSGAYKTLLKKKL